MRVIVPQITWHSRDPVLSVDFDPSWQNDTGFYRVATGGGDCQVLVWSLSAADTLKPELSCVAELKRHEKPVNVVRFSPDGNLIASGGDDAYIILWKQGEKAGEGSESWMFEKSLRKHIEDVTDLSWSPDSNFLVSASIDNSAVLWDVKKGAAVHVWSEKEHTGFVHGVSYDPMHQFVATMCIDRNLRFYDVKTNKLVHKALKYPETWITQTETTKKKKSKIIEKENVSGVVDEKLSKKKITANAVNRLFQDEYLPTFCRRLSFSPRGELLLVPGGMLPPGQTPPPSKMSDTAMKQVVVEDDDSEKKTKDKKLKKKGLLEKPTSNNNAVILFCRHSWTNPCAVIPTLTSYSIGSRFCPVYYETNRVPIQYESDFVNPKKNERSFACVGKLAPPKEEKESLMKMPYRLVYAIATNDTVLIMDTASSEPLAVVRNIHLARITDISWAANGRALMVSSTDGYCAVITFGEGELGKAFPMDNLPSLTKDCFPILPPEPKPEPKKKIPKVKAVPVPKEPKVKEPKVKKVKSPADTSKKKSVTATKLVPPPSSPDSKDTTIEKEGESTDESKVSALETTPKAKIITPQKTTLDRWFRKTPKPAATASVTPSVVSSSDLKANSKEIVQPASTAESKIVKKEPEIICIEDEEPSASTSTAAVSSPRVYPMTPPTKPVTVKRKAVSKSTRTPVSPFSIANGSGTNGNSKKRPVPVSPEELHKLENAPIKCIRLMNEPPVILESSDKTDVPKKTESTTTNSDKYATKVSLTPTTKVADSSYPKSPVSSTPNKAPRRIQLITLAKPTGNEGNLD